MRPISLLLVMLWLTTTAHVATAFTFVETFAPEFSDMTLFYGAVETMDAASLWKLAVGFNVQIVPPTSLNVYFFHRAAPGLSWGTPQVTNAGLGSVLVADDFLPSCCMDATGSIAWVGAVTQGPVANNRITCFKRSGLTWTTNANCSISPVDPLLQSTWPTSIVCRSSANVLVSSDRGDTGAPSYTLYTGTPTTTYTPANIWNSLAVVNTDFPVAPELSSDESFLFYQDTDTSIRRVDMSNFANTLAIPIAIDNLFTISSAMDGQVVVYSGVDVAFTKSPSRAFYTYYDNTLHAFVPSIEQDLTAAWPVSNERALVNLWLCETGLGMWASSMGLLQGTGPFHSLGILYQRLGVNQPFFISGAVDDVYNATQNFSPMMTAKGILSQNGNELIAGVRSQTLPGYGFDVTYTDCALCLGITPPVPAPAPVAPSPSPVPVAPSPSPAPVTPSPSPAPVAPSPSPAPVPVTPVPFTPVTPASPVAPTPVTPTPVAPTPVTPTPVTPSTPADIFSASRQLGTQWGILGGGLLTLIVIGVGGMTLLLIKQSRQDKGGRFVQ